MVKKKIKMKVKTPAEVCVRTVEALSNIAIYSVL